jgi:hypothetical protein
VLMTLAGVSALFWLVHSFAPRSLWQALRLIVSKMGQ